MFEVKEQRITNLEIRKRIDLVVQIDDMIIARRQLNWLGNISRVWTKINYPRLKPAGAPNQDHLTSQKS
jgi:hypothetical protein